MIRKFFINLAILVAGVFILLPAQAMAWGAEGHKVVGALALDQLNWQATRSLIEIMGTDDQEDLVDWCNWPDTYRASDEGLWSLPQHYINMVPGESQYNKQRDCSDGMCVTEAIVRYTAELANSKLDIQRRQQAFGRVCHFVGDLHQPLHAAFGHDRGGNDFDISYKGKDLDLHTFWDHTLIGENAESWTDFYLDLRTRLGPADHGSWTKSQVIRWTNESHAFAATKSYPDNKVITIKFAASSWDSIGAQLVKGGSRLAAILNTIFSKKSAVSGDSGQTD